MAVPEAEKFIPQDGNMRRAFDVVKGAYPELTNVNYFLAAVAYLANRGHDRFIQAIGAAAWQSIQQQRIQVLLTNNMAGAAQFLSVPLANAERLATGEGAANLLSTKERGGCVLQEACYVLLPLEFVYQANAEPVKALAQTTWICSQVRDRENSRCFRDGDIIIRAEAAESHFLLEALRNEPGLKDELNKKYHAILTHYPKGIYSLPDSIMGTGRSIFAGNPRSN